MLDQDQEEALLELLARAISSIEGVEAFVLGGSRGRGTHHPDSDYDIGVYYRGSRPFDPATLDLAASRLDDERRRGLVTPFGGWGPWVDGGAWLNVTGQPVDLIFRDIERVDRVVDEALAGRFERNYQQGHPAGFASIIHAGEVATCRALWDPSHAIGSRKRLLSPEPLRAALVDRFIDEARFSVVIGRKAASRDDVAYVAGCADRAAACVTQAL